MHNSSSALLRKVLFFSLFSSLLELCYLKLIPKLDFVVLDPSGECYKVSLECNFWALGPNMVLLRLHVLVKELQSSFQVQSHCLYACPKDSFC